MLGVQNMTGKCQRLFSAGKNRLLWSKDHSLGTGAEDPVAPFPKDMDGCSYEDDIFTNFTKSHILKHDPAAE